MEKRSSITKPRYPSVTRRGYTLVECLIASVLLSVSVLAVGGAISASYAQDQYAAERQAAMESGAQLLEEVSALPIDATSAGNPSIMSYNNYSDEADISELGSAVSGAAAPSTSSSARKAKRKVTVRRKASPAGAESPAGDFAIVGVQVDNGSQTVTLTRLITAAEATSK